MNKQIYRGRVNPNAKKHFISKKEFNAARRLISSQDISPYMRKKLLVIIYRYQGWTDREIAEKLEFHRDTISNLCAELKREGIKQYAEVKWKKTNARKISVADEKVIFAHLAKRAENGEAITSSDVQAAFSARMGKEVSRSFVKIVLDRNGWKKSSIRVDAGTSRSRFRYYPPSAKDV